MKTRVTRLLALATALAAGALFTPRTSAFAHAVVYPRSAAPGAYERYVVRVPNERDVATTRVEIRFPADVRVTSFSEVPGWQLEVLTDSAKRIIGAVWTGTLAPERFVELPFIAVNPRIASTIAWPVSQTYADAQRVEWSGAPGSKAPASITTIAPVRLAGAGMATAWVAWAALALGLASLGIALRRGGASRERVS